MAYTKTEWKARQGTNLKKFDKSQESAASVVLTNAPDAVTEPGTPISAENLNKIERGIFEAHEGMAAEAAAREAADESLQAQIRLLSPEGLEGMAELFASLPETLDAKADKNALESKADKNELDAKADKNALESKADKTDLDSKAPINSPAFTGTVKVSSKTAAAKDDGTLVATEAQVKAVADSNALKAPLASPIFTGTPRIAINGANYPIGCYSTASANGATVFPLGAYVLCHGASSFKERNGSISVKIQTSVNYNYLENGNGEALEGTWRACGSGSSTNYVLLARRVA